jgi:DNA-binding NarL/FixJ family response regulator
VTARVLAAYRATAPPAPADVSIADLTARERDVLVAMGKGMSNVEIAEALVISELTVKSHIGRIFAKLGLRDRAAAIVYAFDHGLVAPSVPPDRSQPL